MALQFLKAIASLFRPRVTRSGFIRGRSSRYDAGYDNPIMRNHWGRADGGSANAHASPDIRRKYRNRARYECQNNTYAGGLVRRLAEDLIGTGPRLEVSIDGHDDYASALCNSFLAWANDPAVRLGDKLRILEESARRDGECFALFTTNDSNAHPVKLNLTLIETDQVGSPNALMGEHEYDGIEFDGQGNPTRYHVFDQHPGDTSIAHVMFAGVMPGKGKWWRASSVLHWFRRERPGQARGVSELAGALDLFGQLRRYTAATLTAAEVAASISAVMTSDLPTNPEDGEQEPEIEKGDEIPFVPGQILTAPRGVKIEQMDAVQPVSTYGEFKRELLNEVGRATDSPLNLVSGNSSGYNFSSGRLDGLPQVRSYWIRRGRMEVELLHRIALAFVLEYQLLPEAEGGPKPIDVPISQWVIGWGWDGIDDGNNPVDTATTDEKDLANNSTTLAEICARKGTDWRRILEQRGREKQLIDELGLTPPAKPATTVPADAGKPKEAAHAA